MRRSSAKDLDAAVARLRSRFLKEFDPAYVENVILPHFLVATYEGERLALPMIDVQFTKENALPYDLWGMLSETWKPAPEDGVTVFLQGSGEARAGQPAQAHLHVRGHARPLQADVQRQGRAVLRQAPGRAATPGGR